jgi:leucyl/phenylalanyl-tRNA--protein transferase
LQKVNVKREQAKPTAARGKPDNLSADNYRLTRAHGHHARHGRNGGKQKTTEQADRTELVIYTSQEIKEISSDILLDAYANGYFPMGEEADDDRMYWIEPLQRGIIPLNGFHLSKSLRKQIARNHFEIRINSDFDGVIKGCASPLAGRFSTWINKPIRELYKELFLEGHCHTVETWRNGKLVGGLYGVHLGGAFFGESMFSYETNASKVALCHLVARLNHCGFSLLDTQFITDHLRSMGGVEISQTEYRALLRKALPQMADFLKEPLVLPSHMVLQLVSQTSKTGCSTP